MKYFFKCSYQCKPSFLSIPYKDRENQLFFKVACNCQCWLSYSWQSTLNGSGQTENYQNWPYIAISRDYLIEEFKKVDYPVQNSLKVSVRILGSHQGTADYKNQKRWKS